MWVYGFFLSKFLLNERWYFFEILILLYDRDIFFYMYLFCNDVKKLFKFNIMYIVWLMYVLI